MSTITFDCIASMHAASEGSARHWRGNNVRFALSAAAGASGLLLLGLAVFGQPDVYLRQAREQWDSLIDTAPADQAPDQAPEQKSAAMAARMAQLQQQVFELRDQLVAKQADAERTRQILAAAPAQQPAADTPPGAPSEPLEAPAVAVPERNEAMAPSVAERHEPAVAERRDSIKPPPAPKPPPRQEAETAQSVLARLRQMAPPATPIGDAPQAAERRNHGPSPSLRRLIAARAALAGGQIEDTRRLLQEAQLQLVFRPVGSTEDDPAAAGRAASDVAHALDALSGNDVALSRSYIDRAVDATSGRTTDMSDREAPPASGYAPAYPVR